VVVFLPSLARGQEVKGYKVTKVRNDIEHEETSLEIHSETENTEGGANGKRRNKRIHSWLRKHLVFPLECETDVCFFSSSNTPITFIPGHKYIHNQTKNTYKDKFEESTYRGITWMYSCIGVTGC
jgi:hypothetical protein